jgi:hypothetical protein
MRIRMIPIKFRIGAQLNDCMGPELAEQLSLAIDMFDNRERLPHAPRYC